MKYLDSATVRECMYRHDAELERHLQQMGYLCQDFRKEEGGLEKISGHALYMLYHSGDPFLEQKAKDYAVQDYEKYIWHLIHRKYPGMEHYAEDLYQCGVVGILVALLHYDGTHSFTTYCKYFIVHELADYVYFIREIPSAYYARVQSKISSVLNVMDNGADDESVAAATGLSMRVIKRERQVMNFAGRVYLDAAEEQEVDFLVCETGTPEEAMIRQETLEHASRCIQKLPSMEREVFVLYGLLGKTYTEVSEMLGVGTKDVKRIYKNAVRHFKRKYETGYTAWET